MYMDNVYHVKYLILELHLEVVNHVNRDVIGASTIMIAQNVNQAIINRSKNLSIIIEVHVNPVIKQVNKVVKIAYKNKILMALFILFVHNAKMNTI